MSRRYVSVCVTATAGTTDVGTRYRQRNTRPYESSWIWSRGLHLYTATWCVCSILSGYREVTNSCITTLCFESFLSCEHHVSIIRVLNLLLWLTSHMVAANLFIVPSWLYYHSPFRRGKQQCIYIYIYMSSKEPYILYIGNNRIRFHQVDLNVI